MVDNPLMDPSFTEEGEAGTEHFLASLYGVFALALGAAVWSAMAVVFGPWSLLAAPCLGWLVAWACRYGGRRTDTFVRANGWVLALAGCLAALFAFSAFSATQASPDSGFPLRVVATEYLRLFTEPPWFGSCSVLLVLAGAWRALRDPSPRCRADRSGRSPVRALEAAGARAARTAPDEPGSRAA